jgi:hypothetical protein
MLKPNLANYKKKRKRFKKLKVQLCHTFENYYITFTTMRPIVKEKIIKRAYTTQFLAKFMIITF